MCRLASVEVPENLLEIQIKSLLLILHHLNMTDVSMHYDFNLFVVDSSNCMTRSVQ